MVMVTMVFTSWIFSCFMSLTSEKDSRLLLKFLMLITSGSSSFLMSVDKDKGEVYISLFWFCVKTLSYWDHFICSHDKENLLPLNSKRLTQYYCLNILHQTETAVLTSSLCLHSNCRKFLSDPVSNRDATSVLIHHVLCIHILCFNNFCSVMMCDDIHISCLVNVYFVTSRTCQPLSVHVKKRK